MRHSPFLAGVLLAAVLLAAVPAAMARAEQVQAGYRDFSYADANKLRPPTGDKPQSKLWFQDGRWWGLLYNPAAAATRIHRLDLASQRWVDAGTTVDTRPTARGDALWDGQKLYVVSGTTLDSEWNSPPSPGEVSAGSAEVSRFSYDPLAQSYRLDPGFPVTVHPGSTESITVAKDSAGQLWVSYTQLSWPNGPTSDPIGQVYVNHSVSGNDTAWGTPFVLPTLNQESTAHYDDISAIVAFEGDKVGLMWSNQQTRKFYFAVHRDGAPDSAWQTEIAYGGRVGGCNAGCANDHINLKQLSSDGSGRVYAAVKTANRNTGQPFIVLAVRDARASWRAYTYSEVQDLHSRPMVLIDEEHRRLFMFAVAPEVGGTIYYKWTSLDNIAFAPGGHPLHPERPGPRHQQSHLDQAESQRHHGPGGARQRER